LVGSFDAPSVLEDANELLFGGVLGEFHEGELDLFLTVRLLDDGVAPWVRVAGSSSAR
jgi:hypothetical protein